VPAGPAVRPTSDRVREALFDILGPFPEGARVLDVYAGSGALGLEALSRGAVAVTFMEAGRDVLRILRANVAALGVEAQCRVLEGDAVARLASRRGLEGPFDLVLADPPYGLAAGTALLDALTGGPWLAPGARVVLERDRDDERGATLDPRLALERTARYGRTCLDFHSFRAGSPPG